MPTTARGDHFRHRRRRHARRTADPQDTCLRIEHAINDSIDPVPRFELAIEEDARTVTLTVHEGPDKPYLFSGRAYRRADTSTVEVSRLEYGRLVLTGEHVSFDALVAKEQDLAFGHLEKELASKLGPQTPRSKFPYFA